MGTVFAALFAGSLSGEALLAVYLSATSEKKLGSSSRTRNFVALATVSQYGIHDDLDQLTTGDQMKFDLVLLLVRWHHCTCANFHRFVCVCVDSGVRVRLFTTVIATPPREIDQ